jgi:dihydrofolate synthase / folylpolyglutamate synthase
MKPDDPINDYGEATRYLSGLKARGVSLGLNRMERLMELLGHPEREVPCVHIAGTNGKGSVAAMLESIFRTAGWRTGLYTSPHLVRLGERIQVNRAILAEREILEYVREVRPSVAAMDKDRPGDGGPSYFEVMTAIGFLHFARSDCDIASIEVGLGGRLDATNVVIPEVSVISSISLDHTEVLGNTLAEIATEKAGIIKPGRPVVIGLLPGEAERVTRSIADERGAPVFSVADAFGADVNNFPSTNLAGRFQRINAATAALAAQVMGPSWRLSTPLISQALQSVDWAGRWQRFTVAGRTVILDSSHNSEGATSLDANLTALAAEFGYAPIVVLGVLGRLRARPLLEVVCRHAQSIHLVRPSQRRACTFEDLESLIPADFRGKVAREALDTLFPAPDVCTLGEPGDVIVVTGSMMLAGEVLSRIEPSRGAYEGHLQDF